LIIAMASKSGDFAERSRLYFAFVTYSYLAGLAINSDGKVVCQYFIDSELHTEVHELKDLTFISD
jgi:hypothetical protein